MLKLFVVIYLTMYSYQSFADSVELWTEYNDWVASQKYLPSLDSEDLYEQNLAKRASALRTKEIQEKLTPQNLEIPAVKIHFLPSKVLNDWFNDHSRWPRLYSEDLQESLIANWIIEYNSKLNSSGKYNVFINYLDSHNQKKPEVWKEVEEAVEAINWVIANQIFPFVEESVSENRHSKVPQKFMHFFKVMGVENIASILPMTLKGDFLFKINPFRYLLERHSYIVWPNVLENLNPSQKEYLEQWVKTHHGINKVKNKKLTKEEGQRIVTPNVQIYIDQINSYVRSLNPPTLKLPSAKDAEKLTEIQKLMRSVFTRHGSSQGFYRYFLDEDLKLNPNILWEMDKYKFIENWLINNPNLGMPQIDGHGLEQKNMRVWINKNGGVQALIEKLPDRLRSFPGVRVTMLKIGMLDPAEEMVKWVIAHKSWPSPQHIKSDIDPVEQKKERDPVQNFLYNWMMHKGRENVWEYFISENPQINLESKLNLLYEIVPVRALNYWVRANIKKSGSSRLPKADSNIEIENRMRSWISGQGGNIVAWALLEEELRPFVDLENVFKIRDVNIVLNELVSFIQANSWLPSLKNKGKSTKDRQERILAAHLIYYKERAKMNLIESLEEQEKFNCSFNLE